MSTRQEGTARYDDHRREGEIHEGAEHAHEVGEFGHQGHLTGHEHSRLTKEHGEGVRGAEHGATVGHGITSFGAKEIAALAHEYWQARGCPNGSPEVDWHRAVKQLRTRATSH